MFALKSPQHLQRKRILLPQKTDLRHDASCSNTHKEQYPR
jgi:hypothetical protein